MRTILCFAIALLFSTSFYRTPDEWLPVTSRLRETYRVYDKAGHELTTEMKEGYLYRNSEGSTLEHWVSINGDESRGGSADLIDNRTWTQYSINLKTRMAIRTHQLRADERNKPNFLEGAKMSKLGQSSVEGIVCYLTEIFLTEPDGHTQTIGKACQSPEYGLTLKSEINYVSPSDGKSHRTVRELYEIHLGEAPDPKLLQLPPDIQVLKRE